MGRTRVARAEREGLMLEAAEEIFGRDGFRNASMDDIAAQSGITKALLYQYFGSKEGLYDACMERVRGRLFDALETALHDLPPGPERTHVFIRTYFAFLGEHRGKPWLLYTETSIGTANAMRALNAEAIARMIQEAAPRPLAADDVALIAHALTGAGEQVGRWWLEHPDMSEAEIVDRFETVTGAIITALAR